MKITFRYKDGLEASIDVTELYIDLAPGVGRTRAATEWFIPAGFLYLDFNNPDHAAVIGALFKQEPHPEGFVITMPNPGV